MSFNTFAPILKFKTMKKLLLVAAFLLPTLTFAQPGPLDIHLGIKGGMNFARMSGNTWTGGYRSGIHGGAFFSAGIKKIGGQIEAIYSNATFTAQGDRLYNLNKIDPILNNLTDSTKGINGSFSASYLSIPVLLNLKLFGNAVIQLGPQYTAQISIDDKDNFVKDSDNFFSSSNVSGVVGLWLKLPLKLNAGVRYTFGLSDLNGMPASETWKLNTIQIHVGFAFL